MDKKYLNKIIKGDCIEELKKYLKIQLILFLLTRRITYALRRALSSESDKVSGVDDKWDKFLF